MTTINNRIAALEANHKNRLSRPSPEEKADLNTAREWFFANGRRLDLLPREDMTPGERFWLAALIEAVESC